ncbi:MAG: hypothetical protein JXB46_06730 [Candidatus Eisenbacteria bacterium]|nr:hypothetical protein [Candidatus Eisenbacteria bacterium]
MKRSKRVAIIAVLMFAGIALLAVPAMGRRGGSGGWDRGSGRGIGPAFTQDQLDKIEKIHEKYADQRAELSNRLKAIMVDAQDKRDGGEPDFNAIEKTMTEVSDIRLKLAKLHLNIQKEIRPLLDDDQKVLFDRGLGRMMGGDMWARGGRAGGMMGAGRDGRTMGGMCPTGRGGMGHGMQGHPGMGTGMGRGMGMGPGGGQMNAPWCPFADDDGEDDD